MLAQLAPEAFIDGYRLRPPRGYSQSRDLKSGAVVYTWKGPPRLDGSCPQLLVLLFPLPAAERDLGLETTLRNFLTGYKGSQAALFPTWNQTPTERGQINSRDFVRARFNGSNATGLVRMSGFTYLTIDGEKMIVLCSQDLSPHDATSLRLAEAAALTFRK
jgi:hypothetical protein